MQLTTDIAGQTALVTGGSSGLGRATAIRLAAAGVTVYIVGRKAEALAETAQQITSNGGTACAIAGDLAAAGFAASAVEQVVSEQGQINILVNNAAVMFAEDTASCPRERWETMFRINVNSVIEGTQAAVQSMRNTQVEGHIVSISSLASRLPGGGLYGATKSAIETYMETLRLELERESIRVTTIIPGGFSTNLGRDLKPAQQRAFMKSIEAMGVDMTPDADGRTPLFGIADDIARAVLFAVAQPIYLNISEMVVRPAVNIDPSKL
jgi:NADP-dependent 3-hydroxy acid dehydrogenase YdfG